MMFVYISAAIGVLLIVAIAFILRRRRLVTREAYLIVRSGGRVGLRFRLEKVRTMIGSQEDNDLVLGDDRVSRHHLLVTYERGTFLAEDLNSLYGTFVDGTRIEKRELASSVILNLGKSVELELSVVD